MKKTLISPVLLATFFTSFAFGQKAPASSSKDKEQSIIIRKKDGKNEKTTIVIDGDKVTINGKPAEDYKDGNVQVVTDMNMPTPPLAPLPPLPAHGGSNMFMQNFSDMHNEAFLGVASKSDDGGATVEMVTKNSPADKAGLQKGDVISKVGSDNIDDADDLITAVGKYKPSDKVTITYKRGAKENTVSATLAKNKNQTFGWGNGNNMADDNLLKSYLFSEINNKPELGIRAQDMENGTGVKVLDINDDESPAAKAGLKEDDVITSINGKTIQSIKDIKEAMKDAKPGDDIKMTYQRNGASETTSAHLPKPVETSDL